MAKQLALEKAILDTEQAKATTFRALTRLFSSLAELVDVAKKKILEAKP